MCEPDYNAYNGGYKPNKVGKAGTSGRCAGGHLHTGYDNPNDKTNLLIIRALDLFLSVPLLLMEPENRRKEMYGKAGAFRHCRFGVEYRSTSNYIYSTPELMDWTFNQVTSAIDFLNNNQNCELFKNDTIETIINTKDLNKAEMLIKEFNLNVLIKNLVK